MAYLVMTPANKNVTMDMAAPTAMAKRMAHLKTRYAFFCSPAWSRSETILDTARGMLKDETIRMIL